MSTQQTTPLSNLTAEVSQTLAGYKRASQNLAVFESIDDASWARQAQAMIDAERMRILNAFSPEALAAIARGDISVPYIAGGLIASQLKPV